MAPAFTLNGRGEVKEDPTDSLCTKSIKFDLLPTNMPSPILIIEAVSTQTRSPVPTSFTSLILALVIRNLAVLSSRLTLSTSSSLSVDKITPSTPSSRTANNVATSWELLAVANTFVLDLCSLAIIFSSGIIFQSDASTITNSAPFSDAPSISSTSMLLVTFLKYPTLLPDDLSDFNWSKVVQITRSASSDSYIVRKLLLAN